MKKVLHVGCGPLTIATMTPGFQQGWAEIRFDIDPHVGPDVVGTITDMEAIADNSVDALYSAHNIEHVETHQVDGVLREFRRVLAPEGFAVINCPDIQTVAQHVAEGHLTDTLYMSGVGPISAIDILYGHGAAIAGGQTYMAHRTAFTASTLMAAVRKAGFGTAMAMRRPAYFDLWVFAAKTAIGEQRARELVAQYLPSTAG